MAMALAARSSRAGTSDGRIPCPVCRQQIHPVAGRCKHCKTDLVKLREQQGVRAPRLAPAVLGVAPPMAQPFAPAQPAPAPARLSGQLAAVDPTLVSPPPSFESPPAPAAMNPVVAQMGQATYLYTDATLESAPPLDAQRRPKWPIIVAIVAGIAIVVCIILLVTDDKKDGKAGTSLSGATGDDRMDTDVQPPPTDFAKPGDPWGSPDPTPDPTPPPSTPDPIPPPQANPPPKFNGQVPKAEDFYSQMFQSMCAKASSCGGGAKQYIDQVCNSQSTLDAFNIYDDQIKAGQCTYDEDAAKRCLSAIDGLDCSSLGGSGGGLGSLDGLTSLIDCGTALSCF